MIHSMKLTHIALCSAPSAIYLHLTEPAVYHYPTRLCNYLQYTAAAAAGRAVAGAVRLPLLVLHGEQDQTADVQGSKQLVAAAKVHAP
jgi:alpha-beta hydrolase superfamily lysophospholipase